MTADKLAWGLRSAMIAVAMVVAYLLAQTDVPLTPETRVILGAIAVALASLNPVSVANKLGGS